MSDDWSPRCSVCMDAEHLTVVGFAPAHSESMEVRAMGATFAKPRPVGPMVKYRCDAPKHLPREGWDQVAKDYVPPDGTPIMYP